MKKPRWITAKYDGVCACGKRFRRGDRVYWRPAARRCDCADCAPQCTTDINLDLVLEEQAESWYRSAYGGAVWDFLLNVTGFFLFAAMAYLLLVCVMSL